jgi:hypothetical protein
MNAPASSPPPGNRCTRPDGRRIAAVILLLIALAALAAPHLPFSAREAILLIMGLGFIVWAALSRHAGLLVPGGILTGMGVGVLLRPLYGSGVFLLGMAGGFLLISLLQGALFRRWTGWPLWPAVGLTFAGTAQAAGPELRDLLRNYGSLWPYLLIAVALWLFFSKPSPRS